MRFPSLASLAERATQVLRRFPWTLAAGTLAAAAGIVATTHGADDAWARLAAVAALGLPVTIAVTLLAEVRRWPAALRVAVLLGGAAALAAFYLAWPGPDARHEAIRYAQLSAALHLVVAFLPFLGAAESLAFWQYNRRLFLGFLRAVVFSGVLFVGIAIALGALDRLFGVHIEGETYLRIWLVVALVVNTWIFLAAVPGDLPALAQDTEYPRALKLFAQYILTPLAFTYLVILLAYLVKILAGAEWPSGWVGWLVASVSVTGILGFLLVHPLRGDPAEGWIRTYGRWLFVGLVPAALMLLVAFWKRIVPYGLTEPRTLGLVLGLWLLGIALLFTARSAAPIKLIPTTLAALLLLTLYGPLSLSRVSITSQGRRLAQLLRAGAADSVNAREASAALRFLLDHRAGGEIAARLGRQLPAIDWDSLPQHGEKRDSAARQIMAAAGVTYVPEYGRGRGGGWFSINSEQRVPVRVAGFDWMVPLSAVDTTVRTIDADSVSLVPRGVNGVERIRVGGDTVRVDLRPLARRYGASMSPARAVAADSLSIEATGRRRARVAVTNLHGYLKGDSLRIDGWSGWVLVAPRRR
ncbi:MAG: DUF4153 domain-containing protein [Gemmatimonadales bacterium]